MPEFACGLRAVVMAVQPLDVATVRLEALVSRGRRVRHEMHNISICPTVGVARAGRALIGGEASMSENEFRLVG